MLFNQMHMQLMSFRPQIHQGFVQALCVFEITCEMPFDLALGIRQASLDVIYSDVIFSICYFFPDGIFSYDTILIWIAIIPKG